MVPKPNAKDDMRLTVDTRYTNSQVVPIAGCMSILEVIMVYLSQSRVLDILDAFKR